MAKILVIDDDVTVRKIIIIKLEKENHEVLWASDGLEGFKIIKTIKPDLIILDVMMPGLSGYDVLKKMHEDKELIGIPVMMLTAKGRLEDKIKGFEEGAYDYLVKPFEPRELGARVRALLRFGELQKSLIKNERLAVVGQLALTIKQEINSPLTLIIEKTSALLEQDIPDDIKRKIKHMQDSTFRIQKIVRKLECLQDTPVKDYLSGIKMIDLN